MGPDCEAMLGCVVVQLAQIAPYRGDIDNQARCAFNGLDGRFESF
jgi:hypothetical protein